MPSQGQWSSDLTAVPVGCDPAVQQPVADSPEADAEQHPWREHKQIGSVHLGPPSVCAFAFTPGTFATGTLATRISLQGLSSKETVPERKTSEAHVMIV